MLNNTELIPECLKDQLTSSNPLSHVNSHLTSDRLCIFFPYKKSFYSSGKIAPESGRTGCGALSAELSLKKINSWWSRDMFLFWHIKQNEDICLNLRHPFGSLYT